MPRPKLDALRIWSEIEDHLVPSFGLRSSDRVVYFYLVRRSRLEGRRILRIPARRISRATLLSRSTIRVALRRLVGKRLVRILDRGPIGFRLALKLPQEIPGCIVPTREPDGRLLESRDFFSSNKYRAAIYAREHNRCFYCLRELRRIARVLDHVIPRARGGDNSYRNLVACCLDCNMAKRDHRAADFLRQLHRERLLDRREFHQRVAALKALSRGKLKPVITPTIRT